ncbi:MAG TPA: hypothetical protein VIG08_02550 [Gemmatimonadales bacterium]|jgi:hypothetical protein
MLTFRIVVCAALAASVLVPGRTARAQGPINVVITLRGDVGQYAGMCGSPGGEDKMSGSIELVSFDPEDGSAFYQGTLERKTAVNACGTQPNPTEDQVKMCVGHLDGSAQMSVTLEVYEGDRGAYVKSEPLLPPALRLTKKISGCPEAGDWLDAYPKDGIMSGLAFEDVPSGLLRGGRYGTGELELLVQ